MEVSHKEMNREVGSSKKIIKKEVDCMEIIIKKEIGFSDFIIKEKIDCDDMVIKEEADQNVTIKTEDGHQMVMKEETFISDIIVKKEANFDNIKIKKQDRCKKINNINAVDHDNFNIKQETNNFNVEDKYMDHDVSNGDTSGDITFKEEEINFLVFENSESISHNYSADETNGTQEESFVAGNSVKKIYHAIQQKDCKANEGYFTLRNRQRECQEIENKIHNEKEMKVNVHENYQSDLKPTSSKVAILKRKQLKDRMIFRGSDCDYCASHKSTLNIHMRAHTGGKPFKCSDCDYSTLLKTNLNIHMKSHTGEHPFKCSYCDYASSQKSNLKRHIRIHTDEIYEKSYKCSDCDYCASNKSALNIHIRNMKILRAVLGAR